MPYAPKKCSQIAFLIGAALLFANCGACLAGQKIIFSEPTASFENSSASLEARKELLQSKSPQIRSFASPNPTMDFQAAPIPDVILKPDKKKEDWTSDPKGDKTDSERQKSLFGAQKGSRFDRAWNSDSARDNPLLGDDLTMGRKTGLDLDNSFRSDNFASKNRELEDRRSRDVFDNANANSRMNPLDRIRESQLARIEEYKKLLYEMPSATAPVSSPNDPANSPHDVLWAPQKPLERPVNEMPRASLLPESAPAPEYTRPASAMPMRGFSDGADSRSYPQGYRAQMTNPNQPNGSFQQPGVLSIPKRPGDLLR